MERLRHDDPPRIGPHLTLSRLDPESEHAVPERRFIARSADGGQTFLVRLPHPGTDPARWAVEAEDARRLSAPGFLAVDEVGDTGHLPWCTTPYIPALPLPAALREHGGPLPEPVVRALGAALAQSLTTAHTHGVTHAGLSPAAVLLTAGGPRLSCFGAARAAAPDGEQRSSLQGLDSGSLAPEQAAGGRPRPPGDTYALGAVLAYASTGHTVPESQELPRSLRALISACLSRDPARRPAAHEVLTHLTPDALTAEHQPTDHAVTGVPHAATPAPHQPTDHAVTGAPHAVTPAPHQPTDHAVIPAHHQPTVLDPAAGHHPPTLLDPAGPVPLPARVVAALARQSAWVLSAELPLPALLD